MTSTTKKQAKTNIDWEKVELAYRTTSTSVRAIAAEHGCTEGAIRLRAKNEGWTRDLTAKVKARTAELLRKDELRTALRTDPTAKATEREQVEISAQVKTNIILSHRKDIPIARQLTMTMFEELKLQTDGAELLLELGELMRKPDSNGQDKRNDLYNKVISLAGRSTTLKSLAESLKTLVGLEREAFGVDEKEAESVDDALLKAMFNGRARSANR